MGRPTVSAGECCHAALEEGIFRGVKSILLIE